MSNAVIWQAFQAGAGLSGFCVMLLALAKKKETEPSHYVIGLFWLTFFSASFIINLIKLVQLVWPLGRSVS